MNCDLCPQGLGCVQSRPCSGGQPSEHGFPGQSPGLTPYPPLTLSHRFTNVQWEGWGSPGRVRSSSLRVLGGGTCLALPPESHPVTWGEVLLGLGQKLHSIKEKKEWSQSPETWLLV